MIALDTNVLVRFLVADDEEQNQRATELIEAAIQKEDALYISDIVLVETVWVLSRSYQSSSVWRDLDVIRCLRLEQTR